jgi:Xaa-Pro aminopeptidase
VNTNEKIALLRGAMDKADVDGYIVPSRDPHISEYLAEHYRFRRWISGFTGSAGVFSLTMKKSGLWTDGRYYIQAENELKGSEAVLYRAYEPGVKSYVQFLSDELKEGDKVGIDGRLFTKREVANMQRDFSKEGIELVTDCDLTYIWEDRPNLPYTKLFVLDEKYSGESAKSKIERVREEMKKNGADAFALSNLDCIMWLFNVRADDIHCCPFAMSYALVTKNKATFYVDSRQMTPEAEKYLTENGVDVKEYDGIYEDIKSLDEKTTLALDPSRTNYMMFSAAGCKVKETRDFVNDMKAVKNDVENKNLKNAYIKDCVALVKGFYRIYNAPSGTIDECDVCDILEEERRKQDLNVGLSFDTIAAYKGNAAMMHYSPKRGTCAVLEKEGMLLIDSGGHYLDGSTDITRTLVLGDITDEMKKSFTLVLKGNIALCSAVFMKGTPGCNLDILARRPLWEEGIDYKCGTGHGVGFLLNVHEGPQGFGTGIGHSYPLKKGMNVTVEPGVYVEGEYGIRTENDVYVVEKCKNDNGEFYRFELLSYCPIDLRGVDSSLLEKREIDWLNEYHKNVYEKLSPYLTEEEKAWLKEETRAI